MDSDCISLKDCRDWSVIDKSVKSWTAAISSSSGDVPEVSADQNLSDNSVEAQHRRVCRSHVSKADVPDS